MPELFRAAKAATLIPGAPVISDAAVIVHQGIVREVGTFAELSPAFSGTVTDLGDVFLAPGLVNAHSHLELAHLRGACPVGQGFVTWVEDLMTQPIFDLDADLLDQALDECKRTGTVMVGDIATRFAKHMAGVLEASGLFFRVFAEAIGETLPKKSFIPAGEFANGALSVAGHSLYTTHVSVLRAAKAEATQRNLPFSLHLAEHDDEVAIMAGEPSIGLDLLQARGRLLDFVPPKKSPVGQAADLGLLDQTTLVVHCVKVSDQDIETVRASGATVCLCPRSNEFIGVGRAPGKNGSPRARPSASAPTRSRPTPTSTSGTRPSTSSKIFRASSPSKPCSPPSPATRPASWARAASSGPSNPGNGPPSRRFPPR